MAKDYTITFGTGDPRVNTGLSPTMVIFFRVDTGATLTPPAITEALAGSGVYKFNYGPTLAIWFMADAGSSLDSISRYAKGALDPVQLVDQQISAGATLTNGLIGTTADSFGSTAVDPSTVFGFLKRLQENLEGNQLYTKATGVYQLLSRGSSTLLIQKQINDSTSQTTKT